MSLCVCPPNPEHTGGARHTDNITGRSALRQARFPRRTPRPTEGPHGVRLSGAAPVPSQVKSPRWDGRNRGRRLPHLPRITTASQPRSRNPSQPPGTWPALTRPGRPRRRRGPARQRRGRDSRHGAGAAAAARQPAASRSSRTAQGCGTLPLRLSRWRTDSCPAANSPPAEAAGPPLGWNSRTG